ncbi:hypothetical protein [Pantoea sp. BAV 3049]|uniref:hypothetical protein n=1 Tax=Pantoea sp. BAV 3049 TaxID=2654188 RepID=UPI00131BFF27|nr:hypothetical protein [Pantoea sp. BAV 3049]
MNQNLPVLTRQRLTQEKVIALSLECINQAADRFAAHVMEQGGKVEWPPCNQILKSLKRQFYPTQ